MSGDDVDHMNQNMDGSGAGGFPFDFNDIFGSKQT